MSMKPRASYLNVQQQYNLQHACRVLTASFGFRTYQVGSSIARSDFRDVDLRCILSDAEFDSFIGKNQSRLRFLNVSISEWIQARTGLNVDFQFQRQTEANKEFDGPRHFIGLPFAQENGSAESLFPSSTDSSPIE